MKCLVVEKWIEPYVILEKFKSKFECKDLTFDGFSKNTAQKSMIKTIENSAELTVGIYMKNVNKFYIMSSKSGDALKKTFEDLNLNDTDVLIKDDYEKGISLIDMAKAEFIVICN